MPIQVPGFSGGDRTDIGLPRAQQDLLEAISATGKPLVVVLLNGSALAANWLRNMRTPFWKPGTQAKKAARPLRRRWREEQPRRATACYFLRFARPGSAL